MGSFSTYGLPLVLLTIFAAMCSTLYWGLTNKIDAQMLSEVTSPLKQITIISLILIILFAIISLFYIRAVPSVFENYVILVVNLSIAISLLSICLISD